ncbi:MAG: autotransporter outer membrane beta-barrel domain-containing protein, partial [Halieaceae bacterium]|nr:autotransporter outer membrane beta-barrel domain-containing protein [Halieaceae bacterium]
GAFPQLTAGLFTIGNAADYRAVMDQLSGAQYGQLLQSLLWSARPLNESITDRMDCGGIDGQIADLNGNTVDRFGCFKPGEVNAWGRMWGSWNSNDGNISVPGYDEDQFGFWGGVDYAITSALFVGFAGGYFDSAMDFGSWGGGTIDYDGGQFAVYGGWDDAVWYNRAILSFGSYSGDSQRNITTIGLTSGPEGRFDADVVSFYNELGRRFAVGGTSQLTPFLGVNVGDAQMDGFTERDPRRTGAALNIASSNADSLSTVVGLRYNGVWGALRPQVAVGWEHEFEDTAHSVKMNFVDSPSKKKFPVTGSDLDADSLFVDAGGAYLLGTSSDLSFRYVSRWQSEYDSQSVMGRYTYKFAGAAEALPVTQPLKLGK